MAKPKRTLAEIRSEKQSLTAQLKDRFAYLSDLPKKMVVDIGRSGTYQQVLDFKDMAAQAQQMIIPRSLGSAKRIQARIDKIDSLIARLEAIKCSTASTT